MKYFYKVAHYQYKSFLPRLLPNYELELTRYGFYRMAIHVEFYKLDNDTNFEASDKMYICFYGCSKEANPKFQKIMIKWVSFLNHYNITKYI